jgi:hypothetical protein
MKLKIEINMDNEAFGEDAESRAEEVKTILRRLASAVAYDGVHMAARIPLYDSNGNKVGVAKVED